MEKEIYLLYDNTGCIKVYSLTKEEANLIEDFFDWLSPNLPPEDVHFEKLVDIPSYKRKEI